MSETIPLTNLPEPDAELVGTVHYVSAYDGKKVYTRKAKGFFQRLRQYASFPLLLVFFLTPWLSIDGRPAVYFDMEELKFHVLWGIFWPQDSILLAAILIMAAFTLLALTVWVGRVWCGFSCPQTVWTLMFIWVEDKCEGDRNQRIKLDKAPWSRLKLIKKISKHSLWLLLSMVTALTFVAYFYNVHTLVDDIISFSVSVSGLVWISLFSVMTYLNAGWLREQVCKHMCPYSRFQSAMYDDNTLLVTYDEAQGEGRGPRKPGTDYRSQGLGDCIDCNWCVQVCPADIDIRDGLQAECIDCGLCIDACDSVMEKMGYEKGLIKFSSVNGEPSALKRFFKPKMLAYCVVLVTMMMTFTYSVSDRIPLQVDVIRDRGAHMFRERNGYIENVYLVKLNNMMDHADTVTLTVRGDLPYNIRGNKTIYLEAGEIFTVAVRLILKKEHLISSSEEVFIRVQSSTSPEVAAEQKTVFMGPMAR